MILLFMKQTYIFSFIPLLLFLKNSLIPVLPKKEGLTDEIRACNFFSKGVVLYGKNIPAYLTSPSEF